MPLSSGYDEVLVDFEYAVSCYCFLGLNCPQSCGHLNYFVDISN